VNRVFPRGPSTSYKFRSANIPVNTTFSDTVSAPFSLGWDTTLPVLHSLKPGTEDRVSDVLFKLYVFKQQMETKHCTRSSMKHFWNLLFSWHICILNVYLCCDILKTLLPRLLNLKIQATTISRNVGVYIQDRTMSQSRGKLVEFSLTRHSHICLHIFLILIPWIIEYVKINQQNSLNYILIYFFTMAPSCFSKTMLSSMSDYVPFWATSTSIW
jgi:hypothetical protein